MKYDINKRTIRVWAMLGMRRIFGSVLMDMLRDNEKLLWLTPDMARYFGVGEIPEDISSQIIDVGISEQNLIDMAAGMQKEGFQVFASAFATFMTARVLDQVRNVAGYMNLGVKFVGSAGGLANGNYSMTHMALEDIADMRTIPNMIVLSPADGMELVKCMQAICEIDSPVYLRLSGGASLPIVYKEDYSFEVGKAIILKEGTDVAVFATGMMVANSLQAAERLETEGISCRVINIHTIKPLDISAIREAKDCNMIISVEEHMKIGGLGSAIQEALAQETNKPMHIMMGVDDEFPCPSEYEDLLKTCHLTAEDIYKTVKERIRR